MKDVMGNGFIADAEAFTLATQIYVRMRRVTGRVIDAMYVVQNKDYAKYVIALALEAEDDELKRCVERLMVLTDSIPEQSQKEMTVSIQTSEESEITAEDIYRAQVPHHYIGALR
ncbi:hypothetical protein ACX0AN_002947 [Acinetobacter baumannii]|uniref:Uncharacterized protein n=2 Tax=Acinetobacter baumannii (strain ATCC 19606 / DSM 30007 / JCM 6841 / CCUG 19606 / CIP 70.34 / NBRC 109757 / NCIMB 12457 / NCTC 12156 / 81) TaxID=575584 RepID=D0CEH5_ACIB2|nr:hypothetical protein [Acinetobacter baumannii]ARN31464.1 hypothetical protein A4U85_12165 [Acinetobacter baumannii]EEX02486.1 hypothetical protein HMPREF0010_03155 [Acinetobacter baumannii ATCC 19606 = CIP 70.34 = JCM 6841]EHU1903479.1 hypothetical protein [Acinetobacter baumannii]EHU1919914.1 hypothetical protein [Acinetobacter baumannii]EHU1964747.1 hypothetical protein [Acinetobacter baumannii]